MRAIDGCTCLLLFVEGFRKGLRGSSTGIYVVRGAFRGLLEDGLKSQMRV